jgi:hypothetical protein
MVFAKTGILKLYVVMRLEHSIWENIALPSEMWTVVAIHAIRF